MTGTTALRTRTATATLRLDGYVRVSRVGARSGEDYISPVVQREAISKYATELGGQIVKWHDDQDESGGDASRPGFVAIQERIATGQSDGVVVMRIDRFARSVADGAKVVRDIVGAGKVFASCFERIDPKTPEGSFMLNTFLNNAELFLNQSKAQWRTAKSRAVARGAHVGPTPIGYLRVKRDATKPWFITPEDSAAINGPTESGRLVADPERAPAIRELFRRAAVGRESITELAIWLSSAAPRLRATGIPYTPSQVRRILRQRYYLGEVRHGEFVNRTAHEPLVDPQTFMLVQTKHSEVAGKQGRATSPFLLRGLLRCASCTYCLGGQSRGGSKHDTRIYRCTNPGCNRRPQITAKLIEDYALATVREHVQRQWAGTPDNAGEAATVALELASAEGEIDVFAQDVEARRLLGEERWKSALATRIAARDEWQVKLAALETVSVGSELARTIDTLDHDGLVAALRGVLRHIFVRPAECRGRHGLDPARVKLIWGDDPIDIPVARRQRPGPFPAYVW